MNRTYYAFMYHQDAEPDDGGEVEADTALAAAKLYLTEYLYYEGLSTPEVHGFRIEVEDDATGEVTNFDIDNGDLDCTS